MDRYKKKEQELLFIGTDLNSNSRYIEIPELFLPYKKNFSNVITSVFYSSSSNIVPKSFLSNMQSRDVLYKFIEKHTKNLFSSISTEDKLEALIQEECRKIFNITDETEFNNLYKRYNKGASIESYTYNLYKEKLLDYKDRLDKVEL